MIIVKNIKRNEFENLTHGHNVESATTTYICAYTDSRNKL